MSGKLIHLLLIVLTLSSFSDSLEQKAKTTILIHKSGAVLFERDIAEIDSIKFYKSISEGSAVQIEEMFIYRYGSIYLRKNIAEIDSVTFSKTTQISPLELTGTLVPVVIEGCSIASSPMPVTTIAALEQLPGSVTINEGCSSRANLTVSSVDYPIGSCPIIISRIYTVKDDCDNTASVDLQITIEDTAPPVVTGNLAAITIQGSSEASAPMPVTTVAALESLDGLIKINDSCTSKINLTVIHSDEITGACPITINRTYSIKDACQNSVSIVQHITIQPNPPNTIALEYIIGGTFTMGSPVTEVKWPGDGMDETQHQVTVSSFFMGKYEVSNAEFASFLNTKKIGADAIYHEGAFPNMKLLNYTSSWFEPWGVYYSAGKWLPYPGFENYPVVFVTWYGAVEYAKFIGGRLPTEAEWEYACRAGTTTPFNIGNCLTDSQANYDYGYPYVGCGRSPFVQWHTVAVSSFAANVWGLHNMHGNVGEWCSDLYGPYPADAQNNPSGSASGSLRVSRGGGNTNVAHRLRSAFRGKADAEYGSSTSGFRVAFPCFASN